MLNPPNVSFQLPHTLSTDDLRHAIVLGVSPADEIHVAMVCHSSQIFYMSSEAGLAVNGASWVSSWFSNRLPDGSCRRASNA